MLSLSLFFRNGQKPRAATRDDSKCKNICHYGAVWTVQMRRFQHNIFSDKHAIIFFEEIFYLPVAKGSQDVSNAKTRVSTDQQKCDICHQCAV